MGEKYFKGIIILKYESYRMKKAIKVKIKLQLELVLLVWLK